MNDFPDNTPYIGLDWFVLDLLGSSLIFIFIEKLFALRQDQPVFRPEWQTDLHHFIVNHMVVGFVLLATNLLVHKLFGWAAHDGIRGWVANLNFFVAVFLIVLVADLVQYWTHRAYHEVPLLWRLHAVHHSVKSMDWLAGSRQHIVELLITRTLVLAPIYVLGFSKEVIDAYIVIVGFQAVFNHANVSVRLGPLRYVIVTPNFHHWHHSQDKEALDRNYAAHFAFLDHLFGTAVKSDREWPEPTACSATTCRTGFSSSWCFRSPGRGEVAPRPHATAPSAGSDAACWRCSDAAPPQDACRHHARRHDDQHRQHRGELHRVGERGARHAQQRVAGRARVGLRRGHRAAERRHRGGRGIGRHAGGQVARQQVAIQHRADAAEHRDAERAAEFGRWSPTSPRPRRRAPAARR